MSEEKKKNGNGNNKVTAAFMGMMLKGLMKEDKFHLTSVDWDKKILKYEYEMDDGCFGEGTLLDIPEQNCTWFSDFIKMFNIKKKEEVLEDGKKE